MCETIFLIFFLAVLFYGFGIYRSCAATVIGLFLAAALFFIAAIFIEAAVQEPGSGISFVIALIICAAIYGAARLIITRSKARKPALRDSERENYMKRYFEKRREILKQFDHLD